MRGHFRQRRRGVWELIVHIGRDPLTGRRKSRSRTFHGTKREAERALRELCSDVDNGRLTGTETTVADLASGLDNDAWAAATLALRIPADAPVDLSDLDPVLPATRLRFRWHPGEAHASLTATLEGHTRAVSAVAWRPDPEVALSPPLQCASPTAPAGASRLLTSYSIWSSSSAVAAPGSILAKSPLQQPLTFESPPKPVAPTGRS